MTTMPRSFRTAIFVGVAFVVIESSLGTYPPPTREAAWWNPVAASQCNPDDLLNMTPGQRKQRDALVRQYDAELNGIKGFDEDRAREALVHVFREILGRLKTEISTPQQCALLEERASGRGSWPATGLGNR